MIEIKSSSTEKDAVNRTTALDRFLETALAVKAQRPAAFVSTDLAEEADHLFRQIISSATDLY